jgi:hypothetical protein
VIAALRVSDFWTSFLVVVGLETRLLGRTLAAGAITTVAWCIAVRPWLDSPVGLTDIAGLALALALVTTLTAAATSWRAAVKDDRS